MQKILFFIIFILAFSCKKKEEVLKTNVVSGKRLFNAVLVGFKTNDQNHTVTYLDDKGNEYIFDHVTVVDTCKILVNGILTYNETYLYHREFKSNDKVNFYFSGKIDSLKQEHAFWIYEDKNETPIIIKFHATGNVVKGEYIIP